MVFIYEAAVVEEHRRRGIGRALIEEAKRLGDKDGCRSMLVPTSTSNEAAMALYCSPAASKGMLTGPSSWWIGGSKH